MGIRPCFKIIIGFEVGEKIRDEQASIDIDEDKVIPFTSEEEYCNDDLPEKITLSEILYNPQNLSEYRQKNIVGYIINQGNYDDDNIRALATIFPSFSLPNYWIIPTLKKEEHFLIFKYYGYNDEDILCNRFVDSIFENMPSLSRLLWKRALYYLKQAGWIVQETDLHYMLILDWS